MSGRGGPRHAALTCAMRCAAARPVAKASRVARVTCHACAATCSTGKEDSGYMYKRTFERRTNEKRGQWLSNSGFSCLVLSQQLSCMIQPCSAEPTLQHTALRPAGRRRRTTTAGSLPLVTDDSMFVHRQPKLEAIGRTKRTRSARESSRESCYTLKVFTHSAPCRRRRRRGRTRHCPRTACRSAAAAAPSPAGHRREHVQGGHRSSQPFENVSETALKQRGSSNCGWEAEAVRQHQMHQ